MCGITSSEPSAAEFLVWVVMPHYHETKFQAVRVGGPSVLTHRKAHVLQDAMATHEFIRVIVSARQEAFGVAYLHFLSA